jgi:hypothetical protein
MFFKHGKLLLLAGDSIIATKSHFSVSHALTVVRYIYIYTIPCKPTHERVAGGVRTPADVFRMYFVQIIEEYANINKQLTC